MAERCQHCGQQLTDKDGIIRRSVFEGAVYKRLREHGWGGGACNPAVYSFYGHLRAIANFLYGKPDNMRRLTKEEYDRRMALLDTILPPKGEQS